ncbi:MAG: hypothetical protein F4X92_03665 [Gammaproteobacteria bacterium]|nr:hypothetical protein [Gammaproteobacteria bacterium]
MNRNSYTFASDLDAIMPRLVSLPVEWDGKACVLELKEANYNWGTMPNDRLLTDEEKDRGRVNPATFPTSLMVRKVILAMFGKRGLLAAITPGFILHFARRCPEAGSEGGE